MNALVKVLENLLFNGFDVLLLIYSAAVAANAVTADQTLSMSTLYSGQFVLVIDILSQLQSPAIIESDFELFYFAMEIIDDVFILADVECDKFFVGDCFGFDVFGAVSIFKGVDGFLELTAGRTHVDDHHSLAVAAQ